MRCSKCGRDNREGRKFCATCGAPLIVRCPKCGASNQPDERFCGECGARLAETPGPTAPEVTTIAVSSSGERRHLTVLFCDLVGSTEIAAQLDPEEWRELVADYQRATAEAITRYGGHVAKYLGDGVMAFFGYPEAHENDAERAARTGLAIIEGLSRLNQQSSHPKMSVRVGVDSGVVVVGAGAGKDADVFGEAPNIAARVQTAAAPDTILITAATHSLLSGLFVVEELGPQQLKGVASPVEVYRVVRPTGVRSRIRVRGLTPFVGREEELRLLLNRWERTREGEGQAVLVIGEAGIGKSRLVAEFHDRIRDTQHIWLESAGEQFFENTPFHAVTEMLSQWLDLQGGINLDDRLEQVEKALSSAGLKAEEAAPLIADLLQLPVGGRYPASASPPEQKRRQLLGVLTGWVFGAARLQPVVMVVEDLHWLDPSTLELQQLLAQQGVMVPLMPLYTARPEFRSPWPIHTHRTQITLNSLSARNVRDMIAQVTARNALADETVQAVVERTSGVPLFVEELTRAVLESGTSQREIPVTLHDSLMARLDRLGPAKDVIQIGAVIGGEFSYELLHILHPISEQGLQAALRKATDAELIYARGVGPDAMYQFKHALIRDAAYEALLKSRRKELHRLVARTIDEKFSALKEARPEVLARHWTQAGETESAIAEWSRAGATAQHRNAFAEALESYRQGLAILNLLPESRERDVRELELRQLVISILQIVRGYGGAETIAATESAMVLAHKSGNVAHLINWVNSRSASAVQSGDPCAAIRLADQGLELAMREGDAVNLAIVYALQIIARYYAGDFAGSEEHFTAGLRFFDKQFSRVSLGPIDAFGWASWNAWTIGRSETARKRVSQMRACANLSKPYDVVFSVWYDALHHILLREYEEAEPLATQALELSERHRFSTVFALSQGVLGYARAQLRHPDGLELIRQGLNASLQGGSRVGMMRYAMHLAEVQGREGCLADGLETVELALQRDSEVLAFRPEALRVRGELRLKQEEVDLAEADLRDAIALAQKLGAKA